MKKHSNRKLKLNRETLKELQHGSLGKAHGGTTYGGPCTLQVPCEPWSTPRTQCVCENTVDLC